jgi:flagellar biosynthesis protein FlhF
MKVVPFISADLDTALRRIHEELGPDAIVLSMRPLPSQGLARLWTRSRSIEVLACDSPPGEQAFNSSGREAAPNSANALLQMFFAGPRPAARLQDGSSRPHVLVGPPGVGKTTLLCKWMTRSVLQDNQATRIWRLDAGTANTAEFLNVYTEMLGVPLERSWNSRTASPVVPDKIDRVGPEPDLGVAELSLIDLPGIQATDSQAVRNLHVLLDSLPNPRVHLVLNAAYEAGILAEQFRAFAPFQPEDLSLSHLDEERREGKVMDLLKGTNCRLRFLSTGQKVPGDFVVADEIPGLWAQKAA